MPGAAAPAVIPAPAATVIPVRERAGGELEVLLLRRHRGASFMANAFVFPGGRVDPGDAALGTGEPAPLPPAARPAGAPARLTLVGASWVPE